MRKRCSWGSRAHAPRVPSGRAVWRTARRARSRAPSFLHASSTRWRSAAEAPLGCSASHAQWRGSSETSRDSTPSLGRPGPRLGGVGRALAKCNCRSMGRPRSNSATARCRRMLGGPSSMRRGVALVSTRTEGRNTRPSSTGAGARAFSSVIAVADLHRLAEPHS